MTHSKSQQAENKKKRKWTPWKIIKVVWIMSGLSFLLWMTLSMEARGFEEKIFENNSSVHVERTDDVTSFTPTVPYKNVVFFYPGALVDPTAYAPLCRRIAEDGHQAIIIHMPLRMAMKGYLKIKELNLLADPTKNYILAGHSQGAKMAAQFVYENPSLIDQLVLLGTTHPRDIDLSEIDIPVLKIYGTNDGVASPRKVQNNRSKLPSSANLVAIEGGNHSQFGYYGSQLGDNSADISREQQQEMILNEILQFIRADD
jgi:predicted esterase